MSRFAFVVLAALAATAAVPAAATVTFYTNSTTYFAALAASGASVGPSYDFEDFDLNADLGTGQPLFPNSITVNDGSGMPLSRVGETYNKFGAQSLEAERDGDTGTPDYFFNGDFITVGTGDISTQAFSVYVNIVESSANQLFIEYVDPLGIDSQTFFGGSGAKDTSSFYFLGVIADRGNTVWRFGSLLNASSGYNVDNINLQAPGGPAVPEPASWALLIAGFGLTGAAMRRRRAVLA